MDGAISPEWWALMALFAFNLPVLIAGVIVLRNVPALVAAVAESLKEKDGDGAATGVTSFSRVAGFLGITILASLFWTLSNVVIGYSVLNPAQIAVVLGGSGKIFLIGAALFLPYAFNQLKSIF